MEKDLVVGLGEIGLPIFKIISKGFPTIGYDTNPKLSKNKSIHLKNEKIVFLHMCIPFSNNFIRITIDYAKKFHPKGIVIHSTISPHTTEKLQKKLKIPVIYSATRGVHKRMLNDLKRYTKFFSIYNWSPNKLWAIKTFQKRMKKLGIKSKKMSSPLVLELAKIVCDTSYYGWLINYAQLSNMIAIKNEVDYDEMWSFSDEIHKFLGNRPKMYPGFIGGHCVIPNLSLINENSLNQIDKINNLYYQKTKNHKSFRKYNKLKKS